ncbi:hypothetical protein SHO565_73830 [Streptomyces sp. HO565]
MCEAEGRFETEGGRIDAGPRGIQTKGRLLNATCFARLAEGCKGSALVKPESPLGEAERIIVGRATGSAPLERGRGQSACCLGSVPISQLGEGAGFGGRGEGGRGAGRPRRMIRASRARATAATSGP